MAFRPRHALLFALLPVLLVVAVRALLDGREAPPPAAMPPQTPRDAPPPAAEPPGADAGAADPRAPEGFPPDLDDPSGTWAKVDLEAVRAAMPDNVYWQVAVPTDDPAVQREREEERERWNAEYGKVLSNTATAEEVDAYYAHRQRLSADYVEFTTHLIDHYGATLSERDVGLLELARKLHLARLEELPREQAAAHVRRAEQERRRERWLREQAELGDAPAPRDEM